MGKTDSFSFAEWLLQALSTDGALGDKGLESLSTLEFRGAIGVITKWIGASSSTTESVSATEGVNEGEWCGGDSVCPTIGAFSSESGSDDNKEFLGPKDVPQSWYS